MTKIAATMTRTGPRSGAVETLDILVLAGGVGPERAVSLNSGRAVHAALCRLGHRAVLRDISPGDLSSLDHPADFVFLALHGEFGEDGTLQALLDERGIPYSGSGAAASRIAMDKVEAKRCFERAGVPTPPCSVVERSTPAEFYGRFPTPAIVKPVASGSSVDVTIVRSRKALQQVVRRTVDKYGRALVEQYICGPELTVGVLGDQALPVCEIRPAREFYDYQAKYLDDNTAYLFDLGLPEELLGRVQELSLRGHQALGCRVLSRVDWMVERTSLQPYALEVNTIPGFTDHSLVPKAAARIGIDFDQLCQRIVELSLPCAASPKQNVSENRSLHACGRP